MFITEMGLIMTKMLYEKNEINKYIYNINHQLESLDNYDIQSLTDEMRLTLYNKQNEYQNEIDRLNERVNEIDMKFWIMTKYILDAFRFTNILDKSIDILF